MWRFVRHLQFTSKRLMESWWAGGYDVEKHKTARVSKFNGNPVEFRDLTSFRVGGDIKGINCVSVVQKHSL